ncbi:MAG: hypothetical protein K8R99_11555 [Actinomycetia bacterium]|nr:hypothetical protein [Actinomycetes bacterium]
MDEDNELFSQVMKYVRDIEKSPDVDLSTSDRIGIAQTMALLAIANELSRVHVVIEKDS